MACSSDMIMESIWSSEQLANFHPIKQRYVLENSTICDGLSFIRIDMYISKFK
jgi:hypothetical protein